MDTMTVRTANVDLPLITIPHNNNENTESRKRILNSKWICHEEKENWCALVQNDGTD